MPAKKYDNDDVLLNMLSSDDGQAINILYLKHHTRLFNVINNIIQDEESSKDLIQDLFCALWERRHTLQIKKPIIRYLIKSAVNRSYNFLRDSKRHTIVQIRNQDLFEKETVGKNPENPVEVRELKDLINSALLTMPSKSKVAFILSRKHSMTYNEIAAHLDISKKAVEKRMSKSIKHLQSSLGPYLKGLLMLIVL